MKEQLSRGYLDYDSLIILVRRHMFIAVSKDHTHADYPVHDRIRCQQSPTVCWQYWKYLHNGCFYNPLTLHSSLKLLTA